METPAEDRKSQTHTVAPPASGRSLVTRDPEVEGEPPEGGGGGGMAGGGGGGEGGSLPLRLAASSLRRPEEAPREQLHLLPCRLQHRGEAPVRRYFQAAIRSAGPGESSVSFRGRSLKGIQVSVPEGYVGLVLEKDEAPLSALEERQVHVKSAFESLMVWNLEEAPKSTDEILMALHWPKIAEGIHATVAD